MRVTTGVFMLVALALAAGALPNGARGQQTPPAKSGVAAPQSEAMPAGDLFLPPMRGTPDGRISGGTRGLPPTPKSQDDSSARSTQAAPGGQAVGSTPDWLTQVR